MRIYFSILLLLVCCLAWPASADLADIQPVVQYVLPADIMQVEFANETWVYRLYEDGTVKKVVSARDVVSRNQKKVKNPSVTGPMATFQRVNPFLGA